MKKSMKLAAAGALAAALVAGSAISASAVTGGWRDCPTGKVIELASSSSGWTYHYANGGLVNSAYFSSTGSLTTMTYPSVNSFEILGSPLYSWGTSCRG